MHSNDFHPERWLDDVVFENDQKQAARPVAVGTPNCIGMNLAFVELRLTMARGLWNSNRKLDKSCTHWVDDMIEYLGRGKTPFLFSLSLRQK